MSHAINCNTGAFRIGENGERLLGDSADCCDEPAILVPALLSLGKLQNTMVVTSAICECVAMDRIENHERPLRWFIQRSINFSFNAQYGLAGGPPRRLTATATVPVFTLPVPDFGNPTGSGVEPMMRVNNPCGDPDAPAGCTGVSGLDLWPTYSHAPGTQCGTVEIEIYVNNVDEPQNGQEAASFLKLPRSVISSVTNIQFTASGVGYDEPPLTQGTSDCICRNSFAFSLSDQRTYLEGLGQNWQWNGTTWTVPRTATVFWSDCAINGINSLQGACDQAGTQPNSPPSEEILSSVPAMELSI